MGAREWRSGIWALPEVAHAFSIPCATSIASFDQVLGKNFFNAILRKHRSLDLLPRRCVDALGYGRKAMARPPIYPILVDSEQVEAHHVERTRHIHAPADCQIFPDWRYVLSVA